MGNIKRNAYSGFTLLETLVALSVLAISLGVVYQVFSSAMRGTTLASDYAKASMYADSHLAQINQSVHLLHGKSTGEYNKNYQWDLLVQSLDSENKGNVQTGKIHQYKVVLDVYWKSGLKQRSIRATTYRLSNEL